MSTFSDIEVRGPRCKMLVNIQYAERELLDALSGIDQLLDDHKAQVIKNQRKVRVVRLPLHLSGRVLDCHIKQYKIFSLRKRIEVLFTSSGARRAWRGATKLCAADIPTAEPIAAVERTKWGLLRDSCFISRTIPDAEISVDYFRRNHNGGPSADDSRHGFVRSLALAFRRLHQADIYHNDLKDYNILVTSGRKRLKFWFLDVDCVSRFRGMTARRRNKNFVQLNRTLGKEMTTADKTAFLREYFKVKPGEDFSREHEKVAAKILGKSRS